MPFDDPLGSFCVQVHVKYTTGLARTEDGGGSAFAGWQSGQTVLRQPLLPGVSPTHCRPDEGTAVVTKTGELVAGDVVFTVTATNPTTAIAPDVVVVEALPARLAPWTVPPECALGAVDFIARCEIGDLAGGASVDLVFSATPAADVCGAFSNYALDDRGYARGPSADLVIVDVPCPPRPGARSADPDDQGVVADPDHGPGHGLLFRDLRRRGTGRRRERHLTDELPEGVEWSIGSGSNVCSIDGTALTCFAESGSGRRLRGPRDHRHRRPTPIAGRIVTKGTADFEWRSRSRVGLRDLGDAGGHRVRTVAPSEVTAPTPTEASAGGGGGDGGAGWIPDTAAGSSPPTGLFTVAAAFLAAASVLLLRTRKRA